MKNEKGEACMMNFFLIKEASSGLDGDQNRLQPSYKTEQHSNCKSKYSPWPKGPLQKVQPQHSKTPNTDERQSRGYPKQYKATTTSSQFA
jgi:hypothetical protein